ncbi:MAG TPA: OB-fold domain-containing protein [Ureibacillus sp.]|nr:OB-fold domain-containing protein [Ureibacillus sp.]
MKVYECCGIESVTKKVYCSSCGKEIINETEVPDEGTVYSYTVIQVPPAQFAHLAPYTVALIQLKNSKAKVTARILDKVEIGDHVKLDSIEDGAYVFIRLGSSEVLHNS